MREERRTPLHELPALVPRQGMHVVSSLVLVLILVLLVHVGNQVGHSLHELGLHGHQLFHGQRWRRWWWVGVAGVVGIVGIHYKKCVIF